MDGDAGAQRAVGRQVDFIVIFGADEGIGRDLVKPLGEQRLIDQALKFLFGRVTAVGCAADGCHRDFIIAVKAGDFLGDVGLVLQVAAEGGRQDIVAVDFAFQAREDAAHLPDRDLDPQELVDPLRFKLDTARLMTGVVGVDHAADHLARAKQLNKLAGALDSRNGGGGVELLFKAAGRLRAHTKLFGGRAHGRAVETGRFEHDHICIVHDAAVFAAHDARDRRGLGHVGDDEHFRGQRTRDAVERHDGFTRLGVAHNDFAAFHILIIERVHRLAVFQHNIVCDIDDIVDRTHAAGAQALAHPARRRFDFDIFDHARRVARAQRGGCDLDGKIAVDIAGRAFDDGRFDVERLIERDGRFARQPRNRQTIRPVRGDFKLNARVV